jgi:hypothetical protein
MTHSPRCRPALPRCLTGAARPAILAACLLVVAAVLGACSSPATSSTASALTSQASASASSSPAATGKAAAGVNDWTHVLQVLGTFQKSPPKVPVVVLLGGSAARESTISDASWAKAIAQKGGPAVQIVGYLPKGSLVFVGINIGRFTEPKSSPTVTPAGTATLDPYTQHLYSVSNRLSDAKKRLMLQQWLVKRYPEFKKHFKLNAALLTTLVKKCQARGLHVVLLDLPRNTAIIGSSLSKPVSRMTAACKAVAEVQGVPWVDFVAQAHLRNSSFYDLWHVVVPGRATWQSLLSARAAKLLKQYGTP